MTTSTDPTAPEAPSSTYDQGVLREIARPVRWLSAAIVDAANAGRANHSATGSIIDAALTLVGR